MIETGDQVQVDDHVATVGFVTTSDTGKSEQGTDVWAPVARIAIIVMALAGLILLWRVTVLLETHTDLLKEHNRQVELQYKYIRSLAETLSAGD
ncbi:MAG: hypothetical protein MJE77_27225 [Proteobacteria bacterium]|nr:hypothetical protein [Pseudomonadota bacterium]